MSGDKWSKSEKKVAYRVFEAALKAELAEIMVEFKAGAAAASEPDDMWSIEEYLRRKRREINDKYDYRYSQLPMLFARLLHEGRVQEAQLTDLSEETLSYIHRWAAAQNFVASARRSEANRDGAAWRRADVHDRADPSSITGDTPSY
jgi:hypothetical protein